MIEKYQYFREKDKMNTGIKEENAINDYVKSLRKLKELNIIKNKKDFTSQFGEWFVKKIYGGKLATNPTQKDWDLKLNDNHIQIKTNSKAETNKNRWTKIQYDHNSEIDEIIFVIFTEDYRLKEFYKAKWDKNFIKNLVKTHKSRRVVNWNDLKEFQIDIKDLPNQKFISHYFQE